VKFCSRLLVLFVVGLMACSTRRALHAQSLFITHPDDASRHIEYFLERPAGPGPWPAIIFLHGHQERQPTPGGKVYVNWGVLHEFARRGYLAVSVSQPGYGESGGPPDFCGPFTVHAVEAVVARLRADRLAQPGKVLIEGVSRGAIVAGLLAAHDPFIKGIVLISGEYDLREMVSHPKSPIAIEIAEDIVAESGGSKQALSARSVLDVASQIKASALILNGAKDDRTDPAQALRLAQEINRHGGHARAIIYPQYGHQIPVDVRNKDVDPFIDSLLKK
jgi:dipeptidyl aminopeptidase/acylaminoacyl peptidase